MTTRVGNSVNDYEVLDSVKTVNFQHFFFLYNSCDLLYLKSKIKPGTIQKAQSLLIPKKFFRI